MTGFDPRSFIIISAVAGMLSSFVFFILRRSFPKEIGGITEWAWSCLLMVGGAFLFAARDFLPPLLSIVAPNMLVIVGIMLLYISVRRFAGFAVAYWKWMLALALIGVALVWLTLVNDSYQGRVVLVTLINMTLFFASAIVIFRLRKRGFPEHLTVGIFLLTGAVSFMRFLVAASGYAPSGYRNDNSLVQQIYLATFAFSLIALSLGFMLMVSGKLQLRLEYSASHDDLTGAYTRRAFFDLLAKEIGRCTRHSRTLSFLLMDIDDFKLINDRHGHPAGDRVIRNFASLAASELRNHDVLCRYGGEEFAVLLPDTGLDQALVVAERIRSRFAVCAVDGMPPSTVSIGAVYAHGGKTEIGHLIESADQALYAAKKAGKDRIVAAAPPTSGSVAPRADKAVSCA